MVTTGNFTTHSEAETRALAARLGNELSPGSVIAMHGQLGAGKTCFVTGLARALGVTQPVTSPTFTVINEYAARLPLYHMDLYRIGDPDELWALGFDDYLSPDGITVIEWPERAGDLLPPQTINVQIEVQDTGADGAPSSIRHIQIGS